jgi:hypothetical protein
MKTVLSYRTNKGFAQGWLPVASSRPQQVAAENDNTETGSVSASAVWTAGLRQWTADGALVPRPS